MNPNEDVVREAEKILSAEAKRLETQVLADMTMEQTALLGLVDLTQKLAHLVLWLREEGYAADSRRLVDAVDACADVGLEMCDRVGRDAGE